MWAASKLRRHLLDRASLPRGLEIDQSDSYRLVKCENESVVRGKLLVIHLHEDLVCGNMHYHVPDAVDKLFMRLERHPNVDAIELRDTYGESLWISWIGGCKH